MTKLSFIDEEARRVLHMQPGPRADGFQAAVLALCEAHWPKMRGPQPSTRLGRALWGLRPHLADCFIHLVGVADPELAELLGDRTPMRGLAALALAEIARGDAEGAHAAYEAMRLFESPGARADLIQAALAPAGGHAPEVALRHAHRPAVWRAVVGVATLVGRSDTAGVLQALKLVAQIQAAPAPGADEPDMHAILALLHELGVSFVGVDETGRIHAVHGDRHERLGAREVADMLAEGQQLR